LTRYILYIILLSTIIFFSDIFQKTEYAPDDTFIYMQYARNIASGNGFSFNAGEPSYGITSPLWVFILTVPYFAGINAFWYTKILDLFFAAFSIFLFFQLTRFFFKTNDFLRYVAVSVFILNAWFIRWAFTGMETSFAVFLVLCVFILFYSKNFGLMFFVLGAMCLVRPESFVLFLILLPLILNIQIKERNFNLYHVIKYIFLFSITLVPFLIYAKQAFGTILPNTALGKSTLTFNLTVILIQLREILKTLAGASLIEMVLSVFFIFTVIKKKDFQNTLPLILWITGLIVLYTVTDADIISRYLLIISPLFILTGLKFIEGFNRKQLVISSAIFIFTLLFSQFIFYKFVKPSTDDFITGVNECFIPIGSWLYKNTPDSSKVLANDVGAIGYYSGRYIIDAAALINRDLHLNREIMATAVEERMFTHNLLKFVEADYLVERDTSEVNELTVFNDFKFKLEMIKKFPSLGISDRTPRFYKVYKIINSKKK